MMKKCSFLAIMLVFCALTPHISASNSFADFNKYQKSLSFERVKQQLTVLENSHSCSAYYLLTPYAFTLYASPDDKRNNNPEFILELGTQSTPLTEKFSPVKNSQKPLTGLRIALDPGHVGGHIARTEERYIDLDINTKDGIQTVQFDEGTLAVATARILEKLLTSYGATVMLTKRSPGEAVHSVDFDTWYQLYPDKIGRAHV